MLAGGGQCVFSSLMVTVQGGREPSFNMLCLKDVLFYFKIVDPLTTESFCDTLESQLRKWDLRGVTLNSKGILSWFLSSLLPPYIFFTF